MCPTGVLGLACKYKVLERREAPTLALTLIAPPGVQMSFVWSSIFDEDSTQGSPELAASAFKRLPARNVRFWPILLKNSGSNTESH